MIGEAESVCGPGGATGTTGHDEKIVAAGFEFIPGEGHSFRVNPSFDHEYLCRSAIRHRKPRFTLKDPESQQCNWCKKDRAPAQGRGPPDKALLKEPSIHCAIQECSEERRLDSRRFVIANRSVTSRR